MKKIFTYAIMSIIAVILVLFCTACTESNDKTISTSDISQGTSITTTVTTTTMIDTTTTDMITTTSKIDYTSKKESEIKTLELKTTSSITDISKPISNNETYFTNLSNITTELSTVKENTNTETSTPKTSITTTNSCTTTTGFSTIITTISALKPNEEIALEVIRGKWGSGSERKKLLSNAGYDYETIQGIVNQMIKDMFSATTSTTATDATKTTDCTTTTTITVTNDDSSSTIITTEDKTSMFTEYEYDLLCRLVASEYGGMSSVTERAKIVAAVVNQTERFGGDIESCIYRSCVPWGFNPSRDYYCGVYYQNMSDAVDYYIENGEANFYSSGYWQEDADSWWGDGRYNHFYKA